MVKITSKQSKFCLEYLIDLNGTQAAIRSGYSKKTAKEIAYELLTKPHIQDEIAQLQAEVAKNTSITIDSVVKGISEIANEAKGSGDLSNALKSLDMLMKHLGGYDKDKNRNITSTVKYGGLADFYAAVRTEKE